MIAICCDIAGDRSLHLLLAQGIDHAVARPGGFQILHRPGVRFGKLRHRLGIYDRRTGVCAPCVASTAENSPIERPSGSTFRAFQSITGIKRPGMPNCSRSR